MRTTTETADQLRAGDVIIPNDRSAGAKPRKVYRVGRIPNGCGFPKGSCGYRPSVVRIELSNRAIITGEDTEFEVVL